MNPNQRLFVCFLVVVVSAEVSIRNAAADDYVWARSQWGVSPGGPRASSMTNGYGGYYVRRNAPGNNYEGQGRFTNPNGFVIPAQSGTYTVPQQSYVVAHPVQVAAPTQVTTPTTVPSQPAVPSVPTQTATPAATPAAAPVLTQPMQIQQYPQPYRLRRRGR